jgi:hypothetical protein
MSESSFMLSLKLGWYFFHQELAVLAELAWRSVRPGIGRKMVFAG